jgi:hypothetical protein
MPTSTLWSFTWTRGALLRMTAMRRHSIHLCSNRRRSACQPPAISSCPASLQAAFAPPSRSRSCRRARASTRPGHARWGERFTAPPFIQHDPSVSLSSHGPGSQRYVFRQALPRCVLQGFPCLPLAPPPPTPLQRVSVKGTPLKVAHYAEADLFAVLCSRQVGVLLWAKRRRCRPASLHRPGRCCRPGAACSATCLPAVSLCCPPSCFILDAAY